MTRYSASEIQGINKRKKIVERTVKELVGSSPEEFLNPNRYKTTIKKSSNIDMWVHIRAINLIKSFLKKSIEYQILL